MKKNYFILLFNRIFQKIGSINYDYSNSVWIASMGSLGQKYLGIYQFSENIILIIFNPIAGAIADRNKRKKILLITDIISAILCILISFIGNDILLLYGITIANILLSVTYSFSSTAFQSLVPKAIEKNNVISFNSNVETSLQVLSIISPLVSYYIYKLFGIRTAILINGFCFLASFILMLFIKEDESIKYSKDSSEIKKAFIDLFDEIKSGLVYIKTHKQILELLILSALVNFFLSFFNYVLPFSNVIFNNDEAYTSLIIYGSIGSLLGAILSKFLNNTRKTMLLSLAISGIGIMIISFPILFNAHIFISNIGNFIFTTSLTIYNIHFTSIIQQNVSDEYLGRVFSTVFTIAILFMPLGTAIITFVPTAVNAKTFFITGLGVILSSVLVFYGDNLLKLNRK